MDGPLESWRCEAAAQGMDLVSCFSLPAAREQLGEAVALLPDFGRAAPAALVLGNTRAAWPRFLGALDRNLALRRQTDPFDTWVEAAITAFVRALDRPAFVAFAHDPTRRLPIQRLAELAGLAQLGPAHLSVHPTHGPWISLRAVVVLDEDAPAVESASPRPCAGCDSPCVEALERAMSAGVPTSQEEVASRWRDWVAVREACPVGRDARFVSEQVEYHYRQDGALLARKSAQADPS